MPDLVADLGQYSVLVKTNLTAEPVQLLARGTIERLCEAGAFVYVVGSLTNEPPGLWEYDPSTGKLRLVVVNPERPFHYARNADVQCGKFTNSVGETLTYHLLPPAQIAKDKKYPVFLGQSPYAWRGHQNAVANAGAYWMSVDRPSFHDARINNWTEDVMSGYGEVAKLPDVDTNNVFLYGSSAEVGYLNALVRDQPALWKGALLFHAGGFPDLTAAHMTKVYIDAGEIDAAGVKSAAQFQDNALRTGVRVSYVVHADSGHTMHSQSAQRERIEQISEFLIKH